MIRAIAFYLPQYHPIPENDAWWGKGFTEWRNVVKARPLFEGHQQPHIPSDLGFYDLRLAETRQAQADLARQYGISGFCYYHYWFNGRRLLQRPLDEVLDSGKPDFPFCICWANEDWTRNWDGHKGEMLIEQTHSAADDQRHIRHLLPFLMDRRYIKIDGKPLLLVYRANLLPDPQETAKLWRSEAERKGLPGLYICNVVSSDVANPDPSAYGFDAAVEFQPDWRFLPPRIPPKPKRFGRFRKLDGPYYRHAICRYSDLVATMMEREDPDFKMFPCVTPRWDNSPRRKKGANIFRDSSPELYSKWLKHVVDQVKRQFSGDEQILFINAWNEWAEGNHLEPDLKWGRAYLDATREALATEMDPNCGGL